jgi:putative ABC transport system permease protein
MAVINESTAKRYFGSAAKAMGRYFETDGNQRFTVSGVCKDWPENSRLPLKQSFRTSWKNMYRGTYRVISG